MKIRLYFVSNSSSSSWYPGMTDPLMWFYRQMDKLSNLFNIDTTTWIKLLEGIKKATEEYLLKYKKQAEDKTRNLEPAS